MKTVKLHDADMNVVSIVISNELVEHYNMHPDFDSYDADSDAKLDQFWSTFNDILYSQYPDFEDKFDMSELFEQLETIR